MKEGPEKMHLIISVTKILELIDPVDPDQVQHLGEGVYEAKWAPPILEMEIEVLRRTPGIEIISDVLEPLPGWAAIRFTVQEER
jgi:hypothetical protein